jgi:hypothetical protein
MIVGSDNFHDESQLFMKPAFFLTCFVVSFLTSVSPTWAQPGAAAAPQSKTSAAKVVLPAGITEEMLSPPPVPRFMLEKPAQPLSVDEMLQQAREAEKKAGIKPAPKPTN